MHPLGRPSQPLPMAWAHQKLLSSCNQAQSGAVVLNALYSNALGTPKAATGRGSNAGQNCKAVIMAKKRLLLPPVLVAAHTASQLALSGQTGWM